MSADWTLALIMGAVAALYAFVGHGGASAYLAVMALAGFAPSEMRVSALSMNVAVSALAAVWFFRDFRWGSFWPFAVTAVPFAWLGGGVHVGARFFHVLVGLALLVAAARLFLPDNQRPARQIPVPLACMLGAAMGFLSGLVGVGGGIFLTPVLILTGWAAPRQAAAVSAVFILVNSLAGLAGLWQSGGMNSLPAAFGLWMFAAVCGGFTGARWGSRRVRPSWLRPVLGVVLVIAAAKFGGLAFS